jgi:hypothetical protein
VFLLAVQSWEPNAVQTALGSRLGIKIIAQVPPEDKFPWKLRITSSCCSTELASSLAPFPAQVTKFFNGFIADNNILTASVRTAAGLPEGALVSIDGLRVRNISGPRVLLDTYASTSPTDGGYNALPYALTLRLTIEDEQVVRAELIEKSALIARAGRPVIARLFPRDPTSMTGDFEDAGPNRAPEKLQRYCQDVVLPGLTLQNNGTTQLRDGEVEVIQSKLVNPNADETQIEVVEPTAVTHPRMNSFAALSGFQHARELFDTMRSYGFSPAHYFRLASLPLKVRYRSGIIPGPGKDGRTVNAQVDYDKASTALHVSFALADLKRSVSRREPLGLTADPRWSWHEYCHVLLAASTGELELPFVHSVGDSLAAIRSDPASQLALDESQNLLPNKPTRMATFPWVFLDRRHDRSVYDGWSWSGTYHRPLRFPLGGTNLREVSPPSTPHS